MRKTRPMLALCIAVMMVTALSGCGGGSDNSSGTQETTTTSTAKAEEQTESSEGGDTDSETGESKLGTLAEELKNSYPDTLPDSVLYGTELFDKNCKKLYACKSDELSDAMIAFSRTGAIADEVSVVYPADGDTDRTVKMLEARKEMRWNDFNGYAPDELPKIENGKIFTAGGAAVLVISDNADEIEKLIKDTL